MSLIDAFGLGGPSFPANSRYAGVAATALTAADGTVVSYLTRRFVPAPEAYASGGVHRVTGFDRVDLLAAQGLGDPLLAWRLADANRVIHPAELTADVGRALVVPLPAGIPAAPAGTIDDLG